jgi:enoyl-[acyl-carrier-protein] reductase (NADH)
MLERFTDVELEQNNRVSPVKRIGETSDVAGAALFLTSDLSSFITGRTLIVDGGVSAKFPYSTL